MVVAMRPAIESAGPELVGQYLFMAHLIRVIPFLFSSQGSWRAINTRCKPMHLAASGPSTYWGSYRRTVEARRRKLQEEIKQVIIPFGLV